MRIQKIALVIVIQLFSLWAAHGQSEGCVELREATPQFALIYLTQSRADIEDLSKQICIFDALEKVRQLRAQETDSEVVRFLGFRDPHFFSISYHDRYPAVDILSEHGISAFGTLTEYIGANEPGSMSTANAGRVIAKILDFSARKEGYEPRGYLAAADLLEREASASTGLKAERLDRLAIRLRGQAAKGETPFTPFK